jgi:FkbM family methyltransferase
MAIRRVALIFDDKIRPDTTGVYCRRALGGLVAVEHFRPVELDRIPRRGFDLYLRIDDGLEYHLPRALRPTAYWAIDTHLNYPWYLDCASEFDWLFTAQRDAVQRFQKDGVAATWLPLACDPDMHCKYEVDKEFDVCFVGHIFEGPRADLLRLLQRHFPRSFVGQRFFEEMARTYSAARTVFNRSIRNDVNMRVFEALSCGSLLMTNDLRDNGQDELSRDGVHLATYRDGEELLDKIAFYLKHDAVRERIAAAGMALARERHTYRHRMETLLGHIEASRSKAMPASSLNSEGLAEVGDLTSIVILTHNQLVFTRECLESIRANTPQPHEVIVVDNASTDGTVDCLESLPHIKLIRNAENRGFPAACNQGIRVAAGRQILLLNNDTVVPPGWLERMLKRLHSDPRIGLVGPCSNHVSGEQQVPVSYDDRPGLEAFATEWTRNHDGQSQDTDRLVGFCLLIRREVIDRVGLLDERFGIGCYEDDDYCLRALQAGYRAVIAGDAFVHHYGGQTFRNIGVDFAGLMAANRRLFVDKWREVPGGLAPGQTPAQPTASSSSAPVLPPPVYGLRTGPGGLYLVRKGLLLSLCMIVRNNAGTIRPCLESIKPWIDEMIVVDTGSSDETPHIAAALGARVYQFPWPDSFSIARNESLNYARGHWVFWMDSDDTIPPACGRRLREMVLTETSSETLGYVIQVHCPGRGEDGDNEVTVVDHVKLFRNRPDLRFEHRIHEQILPAINRAGGRVAFTDIHVVHSGYDHSPEGQQRKLDRDLKLLHLELQEWPTHTFTLFNLGMTYADVKRYDEAVGYLQRCLLHAQPRESHVRKAYALLVTCYQGLSQWEQAWDACQSGLRLHPLDAELRFRKAHLLHQRGRLDEAIEAYHDVLERHEEDHYKSIVAGISGYIARHNLAITYQDRGEPAKAEEQWRRVVAERPAYRLGWRGLAGVLLAQGKQPEATALAGRLLDDSRLRVEGLLLEGQIAVARGNQTAARASWQRVVDEFPHTSDALRQASQLLFEKIDPTAAEAALRAVLRGEPDNGEAWHNLGSVHMVAGRFREARDALQTSLRCRPGAVQTQVQLGYALHADGRKEDALASWSEALQLHPDHPDVMAALRQADISLPEQALNARNRMGAIPSVSSGGHALAANLQVRGPVDQAILRDIWDRDVYGLRTLSETPTLVLDIGAHIGIFTLLAAQTWPKARIIACEADPENVVLLEYNVKGRPGIEMVAAAIVGTDVSTISLHAVTDKINRNSGGSSCVRAELDTQRIEVPALSISRLWQSKSLDRCDLLKLDCEGAEEMILRALAESGVLPRVRHITGEWHSDNEHPETTAAVRRELAQLLSRTHKVTFVEPVRGREGHFQATTLRWPPR